MRWPWFALVCLTLSCASTPPPCPAAAPAPAPAAAPTAEPVASRPAEPDTPEPTSLPPAAPGTGGPTTTGTRVSATALGTKLCFPESYNDKLRYLGVEVVVENRTQEPLVVSDATAKLLDDAGRRYSKQRFSGEGIYTPKNDCYPDLQSGGFGASVLKPGEKQRGFVHDFPVPADARGFKVRFEVFTEKEWRGPANEAQPETVEVVVGAGAN